MNNQIKKLTSKDTDKQFYRLIGHFKKEKVRLAKNYSKGFISFAELTNRLLFIRIFENLIFTVSVEFLPTFGQYISEQYNFMPNYVSEKDNLRKDLDLFMNCLLEKRHAPSEIWDILEKVEKEQSKNNQN